MFSWSDAILVTVRQHFSRSEAFWSRLDNMSPGQVYRSRLDNISPGQKHLVTVRQHVSWSGILVTVRQLSWSKAFGHGETTCSPVHVYRSRLDNISSGQMRLVTVTQHFFRSEAFWSR
jgi:hypothetical protein